MEEKELKPCPFCGERPHVWRVDLPLLCRSGEDIRYSVVCNDCDLLFGFDEDYGGVFDTEQEAIEAWNRREAKNAGPDNEIRRSAVVDALRDYKEIFDTKIGKHERRAVDGAIHVVNRIAY